MMMIMVIVQTELGVPESFHHFILFPPVQTGLALGALQDKAGAGPPRPTI
jgi:hypothetical protein